MEVLERYGVTFSAGVTDAEVELWLAFDINRGQPSLHTAKGFLGAFTHLQRAIDLIWNQHGEIFIWNDWTEIMLRGLIEEREVSLSGPGASYKTTCMAIYALCFWLADPLNSRVVITSTTLDGLRARIWKEVKKFFQTSRCGFGNPINHPHPQIQTTQGDNARGIFGIAVEAGDVDKAVENIQGRHAPRTLVEIDEMTGVSAAIVKAGANLEKGTVRFQMIGAANPESYFDQHGLFSEPENGYNSINQNTGKWRTKRGGLAIHLNGLKSPNVHSSGKNKNPGMITVQDIEISRKRDGENSPQFWKYVIGFWAPEGITKTVLTQAIILKFRAREKAFFVGEATNLAACDPAWEGGDRKPLGFGKVGKIEEGGEALTVLSFGDILQLKVDVTSKEPIHYQLQRQIQDECEQRTIEAQNFGLDTTAEGGGLASILKRHWNEGMVEVEFGGRASDRKISDVDPRKGYEVYYNRVSELWYQFRRLMENGQIRGLPVEAAIEFCARNWEMRGALIMVESKVVMKSRMGRSPDIADMCVVMAETALKNGLISAETKFTGRSSKYQQWANFAKTMMPVSSYVEA